MITSQQAELLLELICSQFPSGWEVLIKAIFFRIANSAPLQQLPELDAIVPQLESIQDLAQIALACDTHHREKFVEAIRATLSPAQELQLLIAMLQLITNSNRENTDKKFNSIKELFRGDSLAVYLLDDILKLTKKQLAAHLKSDTERYISVIFSEIVGKCNGEIPELLDLHCTLEKQTQVSLSMKLQVLHEKTWQFLHNNADIKYCMALIKNSMQQDPAENTDKLIEFLLGTLANRFVSSTLTRYLIRFSSKKVIELQGYEKANKQKQKEDHQDLPKKSGGVRIEMELAIKPNVINLNLRALQKMRFEWLIVNRFISVPFTYLICSVKNKESFDKTRLPKSFEEFLLDPISHQPYRDFCIKLSPVDLNQMPQLSNSIHAKKPVNPQIQFDVLKQELLLRLWLAAKEIFLALEIIKDKMIKNNEVIGNNINFAPLRWQNLPTVLRDMLSQLSALINITNIESANGRAVTDLLKNLMIINKFYQDNFHHHESTEQSVKSPRSPQKAILSPRSSIQLAREKEGDISASNDSPKWKRLSEKGLVLPSLDSIDHVNAKEIDASSQNNEVKSKRSSQKGLFTSLRDLVIQSGTKDVIPRALSEDDKTQHNVSSPRLSQS